MCFYDYSVVKKHAIFLNLAWATQQAHYASSKVVSRLSSAHFAVLIILGLVTLGADNFSRILSGCYIAVLVEGTNTN
jgi:hypothetical protein